VAREVSPAALCGGYNHRVRLLATILWCLAALCWLPWALLVVRLSIDVALGTPLSASPYLWPAFVGFWPLHGWLDWGVVSWWPLAALAGVGLSALGWRLYWLDQDGVMTRPPHVVVLSILVPLLAPFIMYGDARRRYSDKEAELEAEAQDARERLSK
jgi:hypothetical protein